MSGDQTPKLKPSFRNRAKRLSDAGSAYKNPLLSQSPSPSPNEADDSLLINAKRPCNRNRLSFGNNSFRSPLLASSSSSSCSLPHANTSSPRQNSPMSSKHANRQSLSKLAPSPMSRKDRTDVSIPNLKSLADTQELDASCKDEDVKTCAMNLWQELQVLNEDIGNLKEKGCKVEELKWYIDKFHEYNEVKDVAQMVMGRIAEVEQITVKKVHEEFGLAEDD